MNVRTGTLQNLSADSESIAALLGLNVIHLIEGRLARLIEVTRVLKPGGVFATSTGGKVAAYRRGHFSPSGHHQLNAYKESDMQLDTTRIREHREHNAWSQEHLARVSGLGLRTIQRIESTGAASAESAMALAAVFKVSVSEIAAPIAATKEMPAKKHHTWRLAFVTALLSSLLATLLITRTAVAEQIELAIGVSVNGAELQQQSVIAEEGHSAVQQFGEEVRTEITPEIIEIAGKEKLVITLNIFEVSTTSEQTLIGSPELLLEDGANWEIKVHNSALGKSYRLVVRAQEVSG